MAYGNLTGARAGAGWISEPGEESEPRCVPTDVAARIESRGRVFAEEHADPSPGEAKKIALEEELAEVQHRIDQGWTIHSLGGPHQIAAILRPPTGDGGYPLSRPILKMLAG